MTVFGFPAAITPNSMSALYGANSGRFSGSPFTGYIQAFGRDAGARFAFSLNFVNLKTAESNLLRAFFLHLNGHEHRFTVHNHQQTQQGHMLTGPGTPLVKGADQTGAVLETDGWTAGITLNAGNLLSFPNADGFDELKMVTSDAVVDGSTNGSVPIRPAIHVPPADNAVITVVDPLGTYMLADPTFAWSSDPGDWDTFSVDILEVWGA